MFKGWKEEKWVVGYFYINLTLELANTPLHLFLLKDTDIPSKTGLDFNLAAYLEKQIIKCWVKWKLPKTFIVSVIVSVGYCCAAVTVFSSGKLLEAPEIDEERKEKHQQDLERKSF